MGGGATPALQWDGGEHFSASKPTARARLQLLGRADGVVIAQGLKFNVQGPEAALRKLPELRDVAMVALHDGIVGQQIGIAVELAVAMSAQAQAKWCAEIGARFAPSPQSPAVVRCFEPLPRLASGKVDRQAVIQALLCRARL